MNIEKFKPRILDILRSSDLETITTKSVRKLLQQDTSEPLDVYRKELNELIMQCLDIVSAPPPVVKKESPPTSNTYNSINSSQYSSSPSTTSIDPPKRPAPPPRPRSSASNSKKRTSEMIDSDDDDSGTSKRKKKTTTKTVKKPAKKRNVDAATLQKNPFTKSWLLSDTLRNITGETALSRPGVVKALWKYIKANDLQDPANKTFIVCDEKLKQVFDGQDRIHCFTMNKFIGKHLSDLPADYVLDDGAAIKNE